MYWSQERGESYAKHIALAGFETYFYKCSEPNDKSGNTDNQMMIAEWLKSLPKPIAVMACNDDRGQQITEACKIAGLRVPYDVAILGVDNDDLVCELTNPPLSSIAVNNQRAGYEAAELLEKMMSEKKTSKQVVVVSLTHIVTRQSTDLFAIKDKEVVRTLKYINDHAKEAIHVEKVVNASTLCRRVLERKFRAVLGRSILSEIRRVRVEQIIRMLADTNMSIAQIADSLGYPGFEHISRYFRKEKGISLQAYRKQYAPK